MFRKIYKEVLDKPKTYYVWMPQRADKAYIDVHLKAGDLSEPENLSGIGHLLEHYLIGNLAKKYGDKFEVNGYIDKNYLVLQMYSEIADLEENLLLFLRGIFDTAFDEPKIFQAERQSINNEINIKKHNLNFEIERQFYKNFFKDKFYWRTLVDQAENNNNFTLDDLKDYHEKIFWEANATIFMAGRKISHSHLKTFKNLIKKYIPNEQGNRDRRRITELPEINYLPANIARIEKRDITGNYTIISFPNQITWPDIKKRIGLTMIKKILRGYSSLSAFPKLREAGIYDFSILNYANEKGGFICFRSYLREEQIEMFFKIFSETIKNIKNGNFDMAFWNKKKKEAINENKESWSNNDDRLDWIVNDLMDFGKVSDPEKDKKIMNSLSTEDVSDLAKELFPVENAHVLFCGEKPKITDKKIDNLLDF